MNDFPWGKYVLYAVAVLATVGGYYVFKDEPAVAADIVWDWPAVEGCYTMPAQGFFVRVIVDGNPVKTDTVFTNHWEGYLPVGTTQVKVASFYMSGTDYIVGRKMSPHPVCEVLPDTLWSVLSDPITIRPQSGGAINMSTAVKVR